MPAIILLSAGLLKYSIAHYASPYLLQEPEQQRKLQTAPKSAPGKAQASISERNRAAAMARWHVTTPAAAAAAACHSCGRDVKGAAAAIGDDLPLLVHYWRSGAKIPEI